MNRGKKYSSLMEKGDRLWHASFKSDGKGHKRREKAKRYYRQAEIIKVEAGASNVDNSSITIKCTYNNNRFSIFSSLFSFGKKKKKKN